MSGASWNGSLSSYRFGTFLVHGSSCKGRVSPLLSSTDALKVVEDGCQYGPYRPCCRTQARVDLGLCKGQDDRGGEFHPAEANGFRSSSDTVLSPRSPGWKEVADINDVPYFRSCGGQLFTSPKNGLSPNDTTDTSQPALATPQTYKVS